MKLVTSEHNRQHGVSQPNKKSELRPPCLPDSQKCSCTAVAMTVVVLVVVVLVFKCVFNAFSLFFQLSSRVCVCFINIYEYESMKINVCYSLRFIPRPDPQHSDKILALVCSLL